MDNHYHVVVEGSLEQLSRGLAPPQRRRTRSVSTERHGRVGHLFQDRFHAKVIRDEAHLADACAYTWNNPVRAGLCDAAEQWPWNGRVA